MSIIPFILMEQQRRMLNNDYEQCRRSYNTRPEKHTFCCEYCGFEFETGSNIVTTICRKCGRMAKMLSDEQLLDLAYINVPRGWSKTITERDFERSKAEYLQRMRQEINRFALATRFERWRV